MLRRSVFLAPFVVAGIALGTVPIPYYALGPGPTRDVVPLITLTGASRNAPTGRLLMTSVSIRQVVPVGLVAAWLDPDVVIVPGEQIVPSGTTFEEERVRAISQMDSSKIDAASAALRLVSRYPRNHGEGVLVRSVVDGCAASGELFAGDLIVSIDGRPIGDVRDVARLLDGRPSGASIDFELTVDGEPEEATLVREPCGGSERPIVGVALVNNFPFGIAISSGDIGGPSAGLMFALGIYELVGGDDLVSGRTIAGTGEIGSRGAVYPIGGVEQKIAAAEAAGATVFLVPRGNLEDAKATGTAMTLIPVDSLSDAVAALAGQPVG